MTEVVTLFLQHDPPLTTRYLDSLDIQLDLSDLIEKKERTYFFRFDPTNEPTPSPLKADLAWIWPLVVAALLFVWLLKRGK